MSGAMPGMHVGEQVAGAADAGLHLVEHQHQAVVVAQLAQLPQEFRRHHAHAALALHRLDQDRGGGVGDGLLGGFEIGERHLDEAARDRTEAFEIFLLAAGRERRQRAAVEGAFIGDDVDALRMAGHRLIFARGLDRAFHRLGAGIAEEHQVREACRAQPLGEPLRFRNPEQVGDVPDLLGLLGQRLDQHRMGVPEHIDRNARAEVEIALAVGRGQPGALASLEGKVGTRISRQKIRDHGRTSGRAATDNVRA